MIFIFYIFGFKVFLDNFDVLICYNLSESYYGSYCFVDKQVDNVVFSLFVFDYIVFFYIFVDFYVFFFIVFICLMFSLVNLFFYWVSFLFLLVRLKLI